ncbi:MAG: hypothetical protein GYA50_09745 [Eubacteriaceae bacterium]|nr:hypothetical protein [Eubacteriaceae bacterium]
MNAEDLRKCLSVMSVTCKELLNIKDNSYALSDAYSIGDTAIAIASFWSMDKIADEFEWI